MENYLEVERSGVEPKLRQRSPEAQKLQEFLKATISLSVIQVPVSTDQETLSILTKPDGISSTFELLYSNFCDYFYRNCPVCLLEAGAIYCES